MQVGLGDDRRRAEASGRLFLGSTALLPFTKSDRRLLVPRRVDHSRGRIERNGFSRLIDPAGGVGAGRTDRVHLARRFGCPCPSQNRGGGGIVIRRLAEAVVPLLLAVVVARGAVGLATAVVAFRGAAAALPALAVAARGFAVAPAGAWALVLGGRKAASRADATRTVVDFMVSLLPESPNSWRSEAAPSTTDQAFPSQQPNSLVQRRPFLERRWTSDYLPRSVRKLQDRRPRHRSPFVSMRQHRGVPARFREAGVCGVPRAKLRITTFITRRSRFYDGPCPGFFRPSKAGRTGGAARRRLRRSKPGPERDPCRDASTIHASGFSDCSRCVPV